MSEPRRHGLGCTIFLYAIAAPAYLLRGFFALLRAVRLRRIARLGYVDCPHCGMENAIDILATCPRCRTTEYGSRLRCTGCGRRGTGFACDGCGVTIRCA